jgi:hypothetical protein
MWIVSGAFVRLMAPTPFFTDLVLSFFEIFPFSFC